MRYCFQSRVLCLSVLNAFSCFVAGKTDHCPSACQLALSCVIFPDVTANLGYYQTQCGSKLRVTSVYACILYYCRPLSLEDGRTHLSGLCERYANITLPPVSIVDDLSDEIIAGLRHFGREQFDTEFKADRIVVPNLELFQLAKRSKDAWSNSVQARTQYGHAMLYFWLAVIAVSVGCRAPSSLLANHFVRSPRRKAPDALFNALKRWLFIPATFSRRCAEPYSWGTVPPRLQSAVLLIFTVFNMVLCCISYEVFDANLNWSSSVQWTRYIADRTGVISIANLPLIWLFAMRNNLILAITGWSFETAMQFHKWVARISTIEAIVHSLAYTVLVFQTGDLNEYLAYWRMRYWAMGGLATIIMSLICIFSVYPIRHRYYELFLGLHIFLGVLTLLGIWFHVEIFDGAYDWYIWPCLIVWVLDRTIRASRLIYVNYNTNLSTLEYTPTSNTVWLTVPIALKRKPRPGDYYFLYVLKGRKFYESHPFTISSWSSADLRFLIRPYNGFTERLARLGQLKHSTAGRSSTCCKVRVLAEGPYGSASDLRGFDSLLFVVGGTGIAIVLAYLSDLRESIFRGALAYRVRQCKIVWAIQHDSLFRQVYETEIEPSLQLISERFGTSTLHFHLEVFITRGTTAPNLTLNKVEEPLQSPKSVSSLSKQLRNRHELDLSETQVRDYQAEETASERSSLLSSRARSLDHRILSSYNAAVESSETSLRGPLGSSNHRIPSNTSLTVHHQVRPDVLASILETFAIGLPAYPGESEDEYIRSINQPLSSVRRTDFRSAVISCGSPSLADATRAAVVEVLSSKLGAEIEFINESYSW